MRKFFITTLIIITILLNSFNINYAISINFPNYNTISFYNIELLEMFPKTLFSTSLDGSLYETLFKFIENLFLLFEANILNNIIFPHSILIASNYKYNLQFDIKNEIINSQNLKNSNISKLSLSGTLMCDNGCEVIAVNNALKLIGYQTSIANIVKVFQENNIVILDFLINGYFRF